MKHIDQVNSLILFIIYMFHRQYRVSLAFYADIGQIPVSLLIWIEGKKSWFSDTIYLDLFLKLFEMNTFYIFATGVLISIFGLLESGKP